MIKLNSLIVFALLISSTTIWAKRVDFIWMGRNFVLSSPDKAATKPRPLVVLLHGCKQNPDLILRGTNMESEAIANDFIVLAPEQSALNNGDHCWNWFFSFNQERSVVSEMGQIMATVDMVKATYNIDKSKIFVAGISAGGVMAHTMAVCYPDYFKGAAIHSGLAYKIAENLQEAQTVLTIEDQKSPEYLGKMASACARGDGNKSILNRIIIIHGSADPRVNPVHSEIISKTNEVWWDFLDDGRRNSSTRVTTTKSSFAFNNYSVTKTEKHYPYHDMIEQKLIVKDMAHAWGGGKALSANFDPKAPSSTDAILKFFQLK